MSGRNKKTGHYELTWTKVRKWIVATVRSDRDEYLTAKRLSETLQMSDYFRLLEDEGIELEGDEHWSNAVAFLTVNSKHSEDEIFAAVRRAGKRVIVSGDSVQILSK